MESQNTPSEQIKPVFELLRKNKEHLPTDRPPVILICGQLGVGKTTTINTIFGERVGKIGHFTRGTTKDEVYVWESIGESVHIIDLPGLGDNPKKDKEFKDVYRLKLKDADGIIVVISPPRPAQEGTLKTIRLLLSNGIKSKNIIFGYNKLGTLDYELDGVVSTVRIENITGPTNPNELNAIEEAKEVFFEELKENFPQNKFSQDQIIEFDSKTGWNIYKMLLQVVNVIPFQTAVRLKRAANEAHRELKKREEASINAQKKELELIKKNEDLSKKSEELEKKEKEIKKRENSLKDLEKQKNNFDTSILNKAVDGAFDYLSRNDIINTKTAESAKATWRAFKETPYVKPIVDTVEAIVSTAKSLWDTLFG